MDARRTAPLLGIAGCVAVLTALAYPLLVIGDTTGAYYGSGVINPLVAGLLALVAIVVLAAGRQARTDPGFAAGVSLVFGLAMVAIIGLWATTLRLDLVAIHPHHRWITMAAAAVVPIGAAWFSRSLGVL